MFSLFAYTPQKESLAVVDSLFIVAHIVCGNSLFGPCLDTDLQYLVPSLVLPFDEEERASSFSLCRLVNVLAEGTRAGLRCVIMVFSGCSYFLSVI